eukprot:sb/3474322/
MYGVVLASCSYDKKVILWKENERGEWNKMFTHEKHAGSVNSIQWAPPDTGLYLVCGSSDGTISIVQGFGEDNKQPIITRCLGHVTDYHPIRDQTFLIRSVLTFLYLLSKPMFISCHNWDYSIFFQQNLLQANFLTNKSG